MIKTTERVEKLIKAYQRKNPEDNIISILDNASICFCNRNDKEQNGEEEHKKIAKIFTRLKMNDGDWDEMDDLLKRYKTMLGDHYYYRLLEFSNKLSDEDVKSPKSFSMNTMP